MGTISQNNAGWSAEALQLRDTQTMNRLLVSLDIMSDTLSLDELMQKFGFSTSVDSFNQGEIDDLGRIRRYSLLRFESSAGDEVGCDGHIATLSNDIGRVDACLETLGHIDVTVCLNVGVLFSTANGSVDFAAVTFDNANVQLRISVSAYPVADSSSDE